MKTSYSIIVACLLIPMGCLLIPFESAGKVAVDFCVHCCYNKNMETDVSLFRQAADTEIDFYMNTLYPIQDIVLECLHTEAFYLTGGTALSRFYYRHRFSDDLDFFYDGYNYPKENFNFAYREFIQKLEKTFENLEVTLDGEFFKRLFIKKDNASLKLEFIYENYKTVGTKTKFKNTLVDSKENICANKVGAVMDRRSAKDFIDLYFLLRDLDLKQAVKWSELKKIPPDYEGLMMGVGDLLKNVNLLEGDVLTIKPIDREDFVNFTKRIIGDLLNDAKKSG